MGFLGSSVTLLCRRGCTKLGLTWDQLRSGEIRRGLGSSGGSKESRWLLAAQHVNPLVAAVPTELGLEAVSPGQVEGQQQLSRRLPPISQMCGIAFISLGGLSCKK